jgi:hypothetical protein
MASSDIAATATVVAEEEHLQCKATTKGEADHVAALDANETKHAAVHA